MLIELFEEKKKKYGLYDELEMLPYLVECDNVEYVMYGSGDRAIWCYDWIKSIYNLEPKAIYDKNIQNKEISGVEVQPFDNLAASNKPYFVIVADEAYDNLEYRKEVAALMQEKGVALIYNIKRNILAFLPEWYVFIKKNIQKFDNLLEMLSDEVSKETLKEYLKTYILGSRYEGKTFPEEYKYWGKDSEESCLFNLKEDEIILNIGGCLGDTIYQYLKNGFPYKKIISVEADSKNMNYLRRNVRLLDEDVQSKIQLDNYFIGSEDLTIDKIYANDAVSLIEMDIEGAELSALETGINLIKKNRPVIAVCAYHKKDDLITLPEFVNKNLEDYVLVLRKYPSVFWNEMQHIHQNNELVLYAIPCERYNA